MNAGGTSSMRYSGSTSIVAKPKANPYDPG